MKLKKNPGESVGRNLFLEPLFSAQLSKIWGPTSGSGDSSSDLPDPLARGILLGAQQCGFLPKSGVGPGNKADEEGVVEGEEEDAVDTDYKFGPSILWLDQVKAYEENNCTVEIGKGFLDGVLTHEFLMQRHGQVLNCACGHNVDALKVAKHGVNLAKDLKSLFICSPSTIVLHRHCLRVLTPCTTLHLHELMTSRRNLREGLEEHARFLAACLVEGASFLHARNILHRDIAPHNIFLDHRGYAKLANFHHSVCGAPGQYFKGYCGTLGYQAPEVVACLGHMHTLDYWGIGAVVYQFLFGFSPFADEDLGRLRSKTVLNPEFAITRLGNRFRHLSHHAQDAIKSMLCKYPHKRLGYRYQEACKLKWFHPYRWTSLARQQMVSPLTSFLGEESHPNPPSGDLVTPSSSWHAQPSGSASNCSSVSGSYSSAAINMGGNAVSNNLGSIGSTISSSNSVSNILGCIGSTNSSNKNFNSTKFSNSTSNLASSQCKNLNKQSGTTDSLSWLSDVENDEKTSVGQQKMIGRALGDKGSFTKCSNGLEKHQPEKYLTEKPEKELAKYTPEFMSNGELKQPGSDANKTMKNADNADTKSCNNDTQGESTRKLPDPNSPAFVPNQRVQSQQSGYQVMDESYVNAHIYAAAQLLQCGSATAGGGNYSPSQVPQYGYMPQYAQWNPAEGDGINHQTQPALKSGFYTAAQNWLLRNGTSDSGQTFPGDASNASIPHYEAYSQFGDGQYVYYPQGEYVGEEVAVGNNHKEYGDNGNLQPYGDNGDVKPYLFTGESLYTDGFMSHVHTYGMQTRRSSAGISLDSIDGVDKSSGDANIDVSAKVSVAKTLGYSHTTLGVCQTFLNDNAN